MYNLNVKTCKNSNLIHINVNLNLVYKKIIALFCAPSGWRSVMSIKINSNSHVQDFFQRFICALVGRLQPRQTDACLYIRRVQNLKEKY